MSATIELNGSDVSMKNKPFRIWGQGIYSLNQPRYETARDAHNDLRRYANSMGQSWLIFTVYQDMPDGSFVAA